MYYYILHIYIFYYYSIYYSSKYMIVIFNDLLKKFKIVIRLNMRYDFFYKTLFI